MLPVLVGEEHGIVANDRTIEVIWGVNRVRPVDPGNFADLRERIGTKRFQLECLSTTLSTKELAGIIVSCVPAELGFFVTWSLPDPAGGN